MLLIIEFITNQMKIRFTLLLLLIFVAPSFGQESQENTESANWTPFSAALKEANERQVKVLIDVYTDWCGWCKKMEANTYANPEVKAYLEEHYVITQINAESSEQISFKGQKVTQEELAMAMQVNSYPHTVFLDADNQFITRVPGYFPPEDFLTVLKFIAEEAYKTESFDDFAARIAAGE